MFYSLKNYYAHLLMQELAKFDVNIKVILKGLEKYINFSINNKLVFIDKSYFLSSEFESLGKNLEKYYLGL